MLRILSFLRKPGDSFLGTHLESSVGLSQLSCVF